MAIQPITTTKLKCFLLLGHSNGDGWAPYFNVIARNSDYAAAGNFFTDPAKNYYANVYVATSAQPYPGTHGTPVASTPGQVEWLELTTQNIFSPAGLHPHPSPYNYPNNSGACYPRWIYNAYQSIDFAFASGNSYPTTPHPSSPNDTPTQNWWTQQVPFGVKTGLEIPFSWLWKNYWQDQIGLVKMAFSSSLFLAWEPGVDPDQWVGGKSLGFPGFWYTPGFTPGYISGAVNTSPYNFYAYWSPYDQFDWVPSTGRYYKLLMQKLAGAKAALPAGVEMDIQLVIPWFGDNDSDNRRRETIENSWENSCRSFIKRIRKDLAEGGYTSLPEDEIPVIWPGVHDGYPGPDDDETYTNPNFMNEVLRRIAADDPFMETLDSNQWANMLDSNDRIWYQNGQPTIHPHDNHFGSLGYAQAAEQIMETWVAMQQEPMDALDLDETITVEDALDRIRTYYGRSRSNTDLNRTTLLQHLNASMYHCLNHVGDNAWWLRRRKELTLTGGSNTVITLPRYVHRMMRIESPTDATYPIHFEQVGFGQGGKLQILLKDGTSGSYMCQFITMPRELSSDDQMIPAPRNITEWIIVETCARLAGSASNAPLQAHFAAQAQQLMSDSLRSMGQQTRTRHDRLRTQRRMTNLGYSRRTGRLWDND